VPIPIFRSFKPLHAIIHYYVDLSCFLVLGARQRDWWALNRRKRLSSLYALELQYSNVEARERAMDEAFERALRLRRTVRVERLGFVDLVVPIVQGRQVLGFLQAGAFAEEAPTLVGLERTWRTLAGLEPSPQLPEFRSFIRTILEIPVLEGKLAGAFQESLELFARLLGGSETAEVVEHRTRALLHGVISKGLPHSYWMDWALGRPSAESTPAWERGMEDWGWTRDEIGLRRVPTTVLVAMPQLLGRGESWTRERLRMAAFQRRAFTHAKSLPETVGGGLDDYGVVYATSASPSLSRLAQRQELEGLAKRIRDFAQKELGSEVRVSLGETVAPGESLRDSYKQAFLALHSDPSAPLARGILVSGRSLPRPQDTGLGRLQQSLEDLASAFERADQAEIPLLREAFLAAVLELSLHSTSEVRIHMQHALARVAASIARRHGLERAEERRLRGDTVAPLEGSAGMNELVAAFRDALGRLRTEPQRAGSLQRRLKLGEVLSRIQERPGQRLSLAQAAGLTGTSVSSFRREFKRTTGQGFEAYIQGLRIDQARRMLRGGNLPVAGIAQACGFKSVSYFSRLFKGKSGASPDRYRRQARRLGSRV
jgi:AraC-like DNA-binding protein